MKTSQFELVVAVNPGYKHDNSINGDVLRQAWQEEAAKGDPYIGAVITPSKVIYKTEWGCPLEGENVAVITGVRNPEFVTDDDAWRNMVRAVSKLIGNRFGQTKLYLMFRDIDLEIIYMK